MQLEYRAGLWALGALLVTTLAAPLTAGPRLIQVPAHTPQERAQLQSVACEIVAQARDHLVLAVPQDGPIASRANRLLAHWPGVDVLDEDVDHQFRKFRMKDGSLGVYHDLAAVARDLGDMATQHPNLCSVQSIGKTTEGRDILALKIASPDAAPWGRPTFLFMGCHHAREWISVEVPLAIAHYLVANATSDANVQQILATRDVWIVPVVNPDGLNWSQTNFRYWRKNRRPNGGDSYGVDPNRNYGYKWGTAGDSDDPESDVYRGPGAFSEKETQTIRDFAIAHNLTGSISYHSYGSLVMYPWSYGDDVSPDAGAFDPVCKAMAAENGYTPEQSSALYPSSGDTDDFLYGSTGSFSFTIELADSFIPDDAQVPDICAANVKAAMVLLQKGADVFPFMVHKPQSDVTGSGPYTVTAAFDPTHHEQFTPTEIDLVANVDGQLQSLPMARQGDTNTYTATLARPRAASSVSYFFGLKDASGKLARTPRLSDFSLAVRDAGPMSLLPTTP